MKPNFALSLSFEGIRLLHRVGSNWSLVGEVALDAPDLAGQLAVLRKTGLALDPQGLRTKLLIPNDQIKYLALDTTRAGDDDVRAALDGTTPYAVSDLSYDYVRGGGRTYIAAVARETLAEAEAFAAEHRFGPVGFAGVPMPFTYVGEPFFGPTSMADRLLGPGQVVERDDVAVLYQPKARSPEPLTGPAKAPAAALRAALVPDQPSLPPATITPPLILTGAEPPPLAQPDPVPEAAGPVPVTAPEAKPLATAQTIPAAALPSANLAPPDPTALAFAPQDPTIFDSSTASTLALPNLPGESLEEDAPFVDVPYAPETGALELLQTPPSAVPPSAVQLAAAPRDTLTAAAEAPKPSLIPEPVFASRARPLRADSAEVPVMRHPLPPPPGSRTPIRPTDPEDRAEPVFSRRAEPPLTRPAVAPPPMPVAPVTVSPLTLAPTNDAPITLPQMAAEAQDSAAMAPPRLTGVARNGADPAPPRPFNAKLPEPAAAPAVTGLSGAARPPVAATVIAFRPHADPADPPGATPVSIETVTLTPAKTLRGTAPVPGLAATAAPGKPRSFASRHGGADPVAQIAAPPKPSSRTGLSPAIAASAAGRGRPRYLALILTLILLACLAAVAAWASFISDKGLAGLFGGGAGTPQMQVADQPATAAVGAAAPAPGASPLRASDLTQTALIAPTDTPDGAVPALTADTAPEVTALPALIAPDSTTDDVASVPPELIVAAPLPEAGAVVSPAEADRIYAATGVWLRAPRLPLIPTSDPVGALALAALDSGATEVAVPQMPGLAGAAPDQALLTPADPPAPGTVFERDVRGFVLATPEGTLTPNGIMVFAGSPAVIPPNRPGSAVAVVVPTGIAVAMADPLAQIPAPPLAPRPAGVAPDAPVQAAIDPTIDPASATAGGVGLTSLGPLVRPLIRPGGLTPPATTAPVTAAPVLVAFAGPRPQARPGGVAALPAPILPDPSLPDPAVPDPAVPGTDPAASTDLAVADTVAAILAAAPPDPVVSGTALAVASARIPEARPQNFAAVVASALERSAAAPQNPSLAVLEPQAQPPVQPPAQVAAQPEIVPDIVPESAVPDEVVAPNGPIPGGVATNATLTQAIDLREVNLIGVFGRPNDRRALVRLANGRYVRVGVGDSLDGGQVAAIGDNALNYVKRGQTITIAIPNG